MASLAKESLSPLLKNSSVRRRSLDFCQKFGSQLLSPSSPLFTSGPNSAKPENISPSAVFKTTEQLLSPVLGFRPEPNEATVSNSSYRNTRRASDSLWIDTFPKLETSGHKEKQQKRRSSLTQIDIQWQFTAEETEYYNNEDSSKEPATVTCNIIPPTPMKTIEHVQLCKTEILSDLRRSLESCFCLEDENGNEILNSTEKEPCNSCGLQFSKNSTHSPLVDTVRRCSAGARYDVDEGLVKLVAQQWNLSLKDDLLGKGSFGTVVSGLYQGNEVAVKVLKTTNSQKKASVKGEENALNLPFHSHIAQIVDIFQLGTDRSLIIMEKMHKGNLLGLLNDPSFPMDCQVAVNISKQVTLALNFCHRQGLLHLDVKPQNILVDLQNCCKLSDFGSSKKVSDLDTYYKHSKLEGTVPYTAPELFKGFRPTEKCDVYSLAITMWQIITRELPYQDQNEHSVIFRVVSQGFRPNAVVNPKWNNLFCKEDQGILQKYTQLYELAWHAEPEARPSICDIHKNLIKIQFIQ